ncbi:MAG TPA: c-type cytochrome [Candidatus Bathyarchaeia archaeon]|nr:c-type cytochrome [Candidatus Bathyarchaeia archaeon]
MKRFALLLLVSVLLAAPVPSSVQAPAQAQEVGGLVGEGRRLFRDTGCYGCHTVGAMGTPIAPDLSHIGAKHDRAYLTSWLRDPSVQRPRAHMPKLVLTESEIQSLAAYLASLR